MPLSAWLGWTQSPGEVPGFGPLDADDARTLAGMLSRNPANQWCVTLTDPAGHPVAHACAPRSPGTAPGRRSRRGPGTPPGPGTRPGPETPPGPGTRAGPGDRRPDERPATHPQAPAPQPRDLRPPTATPATTPPDWLRTLTFTTLQTRDCTHPRESRGYRPSPALRHLIEIRNPTCTAPGCRHAAARCDLDHVTPYDQGGRTCECNLGRPAGMTTSASKPPAGPSPPPPPAPAPGPPPETAPTPPPPPNTPSERGSGKDPLTTGLPASHNHGMDYPGENEMAYPRGKQGGFPPEITGSCRRPRPAGGRPGSAHTIEVGGRAADGRRHPDARTR